MNTLWPARLKPTEQRIDYSDEDTKGLRLRTSPGGMAWSVVHRAPGGTMTARFTLGTYPEVSLAGARKTAANPRAEIHAGRDPAGTRREQRNAPSFGMVAAEYLDPTPSTNPLYTKTSGSSAKICLRTGATGRFTAMIMTK